MCRDNCVTKVKLNKVYLDINAGSSVCCCLKGTVHWFFTAGHILISFSIIFDKDDRKHKVRVTKSVRVNNKSSGAGLKCRTQKNFKWNTIIFKLTESFWIRPVELISCIATLRLSKQNPTVVLVFAADSRRFVIKLPTRQKIFLLDRFCWCCSQGSPESTTRSKVLVAALSKCLILLSILHPTWSALIGSGVFTNKNLYILAAGDTINTLLLILIS